ncbi:hypothetical protein EDC56_0346 [Sinobacterium caligoides]|uniref:Uncharacterized protein n=1 Tax=Sinobacterium caligoides TaxID=933926 RepID=A0A3N2DYA6_9GAMM|nr:hypothetical protein [Sinobacterium caligoides]ROS04833.1 hypothetical protein EDC56_0346 [Sinobacterium caligoides]
MIQLSKTLFKVTSCNEFIAEVNIAENIIAKAEARSNNDAISWQFDSAFIDTKTNKVSAIFINAQAPKQDEFNLTYSAKAADNWLISEFCSLDN